MTAWPLSLLVGSNCPRLPFLLDRYVASIEKIDYDEERVLIHYRQWSHRYDEWFDWSSPYLRPVERIQLRKEGLRESSRGSVSESLRPARLVAPCHHTKDLYCHLNFTL